MKRHTPAKIEVENALRWYSECHEEGCPAEGMPVEIAEKDGRPCRCDTAPGVAAVRAYISELEGEVKDLDDYAEEVAIGGLEAEAATKLDGWREAAGWLETRFFSRDCWEMRDEILAEAARREKDIVFRRK